MTLPITCGNCDRAVGATVYANAGTVSFLICPNCNDGSVRTLNGAIWPPATAGGSVANLPPDVAQAWREARSAHAVAAYTASEMMCRKILMHLAVGVAAGNPGGTFAQYITDLDKAGYVSVSLKPSVEKIKTRGNTANHDLPASTEADSVVTMKITEHLLRDIYEIPAL